MTQKIIHQIQLVDSLSDWILPGSTIMGRTLLNLSEEMKEMKVVKMKKTLHKLMVNITSHNLCHFFFINILTQRGKMARTVPEGWKHRLKDSIKIRL